MLNLIKLEFKKNKLHRYIFAAIACMIAIMVSMTSDFIKDYNKPIDIGNDILHNLRMSIMIVTITFIIFSAVLTIKILVNEYRNKTILVIFTYPIRRKKIVLAKLLIVVIFTMINILIGDLLCSSYMLILNSYMHVIYGNFVFEGFMITALFTSIIMGGILSMIPFFIGILKKSVVWTLVVAIIISTVIPIIIGVSDNINNLVIISVFVAIFILVMVMNFIFIKSNIVNKLN